MSAVAEAARQYAETLEKQREANAARREAKASLAIHLRYAHKTGQSVAELAQETGYSRQRIYQLLAGKEEK